MKTPTAVAPRELNSVQQTVPMKRSASCGAVAVDDMHQASTSHQLPAMKQETSTSSASAGDLRYTQYEITSTRISDLCINLL